MHLRQVVCKNEKPRGKSFSPQARQIALHSDPSNKVKLADKPGSVVDSHSSRRFVT